MSNPGPASSTTEHPVGGGGSPAYVGVSGGTVGFFQDPFGGGAVVQPSGNAQAAITRGLACGSICTFAVTVTPGGVLTITTTEKNVPVITPGTGQSWTVATNDLIYVNKPTSQAGLGVGNARVSGTGAVGLTFSNFTGSTITATAGEKYSIVALRGFNVLTAALTPATVAANTIAEQTFTVTGVRTGEVVQVSKATAQAGLDIMGCRVVSNNTVGITFGNVTAALITPTAGETYQVFSLGGLDAVNNNILAQVTFSPSTIAATSAPSVSVTLTTLATTDVVQGVMKPTAQAGLAVANGFVSAAGQLAVTFVNPTPAVITATASEVYHAVIYRPNPVAPCSVFSAALTPSGVAANTTAEQTFTVTGAVSNTPIWVNKPSAQAGLGIVGCRVSGTNSVCITFGNSTAATITPTAGETYVFAGFNLPIEVAGNSLIQTASAVDQQQSILTNAIRSAMVSMGMVAGV